MRFFVFAVSCLILAGASAEKMRDHIVLASTTSIENSGLLDFLLPVFERESGIDVHVVPVGTGRALNIARRGDAEVLIIHHEPSELTFVQEGYGTLRKTFMRNDYILVGPLDDPAQVAETKDIVEAFDAIARSDVSFVSRADNSGTHKTERALWRMSSAGTPSKTHYLEIGSGMGTTLNFANETGAYTLCDRATWVSFENRDRLTLLFANSPYLENLYSVILVNPERHPGIAFKEAKRFRDWLVSKRGLERIAAFRKKGKQLFFPTRDGQQAVLSP